MVDTGELPPCHNHRRLAKVNMAFVSHQEWHPEDSIFFELTDYKRLLDCLIPGLTSQLNYAIEGNTRLIRPPMCRVPHRRASGQPCL